MAQLMFRIANEPHPDIRSINPSLPTCIASIVDKALSKDVEVRYQTGADMARDLRDCMAASASVDLDL